MVKKKVGGGKRYQAAVKAKDAPAAAVAAWYGPAPPKHMQRKIARKVNFLDKVAASKSAHLAAKAAIAKKRKAPSALTDLSSLAGSVNELLQQQQQQQQQQQLLPSNNGRAKRAGKGKGKAVGGKQSAPAHKKFGEAVGTLRARAAVMAKESVRARQVLHHPLYQQDPIQAITNHLNATVPAAPVVPAHRPGVGKRASKGKKKGGAGAGIGSPASMES